VTFKINTPFSMLQVLLLLQACNDSRNTCCRRTCHLIANLWRLPALALAQDRFLAATIRL
jgi:hypothetical protein